MMVAKSHIEMSFLFPVSRQRARPGWGDECHTPPPVNQRIAMAESSPPKRRLSPCACGGTDKNVLLSANASRCLCDLPRV
jgi:hypothetical protein